MATFYKDTQHDNLYISVKRLRALPNIDTIFPYDPNCDREMKGDAIFLNKDGTKIYKILTDIGVEFNSRKPRYIKCSDEENKKLEKMKK